MSTLDAVPSPSARTEPSPMVHNEIALFVAWRHGDQSAGAKLLSDLRTKLLRYLRCCPVDVAEDLAHDAIEALLAARDGLEEPRAVLGYLFTVARRIRARELARRDVPVEAFDELRTPARFSYRIEVDRIDAMLLLGDQEGCCIWTLAEYYLAGLRAPEIARKQGVSVGTVRSRIRHGLEQLQRSARH